MAGTSDGEAGPNLFRWNGMVWDPFTSGINGRATTLLPIGNSLYIGGNFTQNSLVPSNYVARWDGPVSAIGIEDLAVARTAAGGIDVSCTIPASVDRSGVAVAVQRAADPEGPFLDISPNLFRGGERRIRFTDAHPPIADSFYRIAIRYGEETDFSQVVGVRSVTEGRGLQLRLRREADRLAVEYCVPANGSNEDLKVYDVAGRVIRTLVTGRTTQGVPVEHWNWTTATGTRLPHGTYIVSLRVDAARSQAKVIVNRP